MQIFLLNVFYLQLSNFFLLMAAELILYFACFFFKLANITFIY